jgi:hypothetical protein
MLYFDFKKELTNNRKIDWKIDRNHTYSASIKNTSYIHLICKKCGTKKKHTVGNIKHALTLNINHCRCQKCAHEERQKKNSVYLVTRLIAEIDKSDHFSWRLDKSKINKQTFYTCKTPVPLICKQCKILKYHTPSNIFTSLFTSKNHITCQECKLRNTWREKIEYITNGHYSLGTTKTGLGFKIIHQQCGHYYYINNPHLFKKGVCPFCFDSKSTLKVLRDFEQLKTFVSIRSEGKLQLKQVNKEELTVSCSFHPEAGEYYISWDSFIRSNRNGKTYLCTLCRKQRLRDTYHDEYNDRIAAMGLKVEVPPKKSKLCLSEKILHYCNRHAHHPSLYASPYQVEFKNKRCLYCSTNQSYHKDYEFIKAYIELDEDRFFSHGGRQFRLLSTRGEIDYQMNNKSIAEIRLRINEITCSIHDEFDISWGNFCYNNMACSKCVRDNHISYAHAYYQALLEYFQFDYVPEYPIRVNSTAVYRIDFKLSTLPNFLEIDSNLHTGKNSWNTKAGKNYKVRDKRKNKLLAGNIERIKLYDKYHNVLPITKQLAIVEDAFIERATKNGMQIEKKTIEEAKKDPLFFRNTRIVYFMRRLNYFHGGHITFSDTNHLTILQSIKKREATFYCNIHKESFHKSLNCVMTLKFLCPICAKRILRGQQDSYFFSLQKKEEINHQVQMRFQGEFKIDITEWGARSYSFHTVVFPVYSSSLSKEVYISLYHLLSISAAQVKTKLKRGAYSSYITVSQQQSIFARKSKSNYDPVPVPFINNKKRIVLNKKHEQRLLTYQRNAREINRLMRTQFSQADIEKLIAVNEQRYAQYIHISNTRAVQSLALYDRKIMPYFQNSKIFQLLTPREKYSGIRQFLLIKNLTCKHIFYANWLGISYKCRKQFPIQCQHKDCYSAFYRLQNPNARKIDQQIILTYFRNLFNGQYYPLNPERPIMVREPIEIIHLPSGSILKASVDNFRRGKFRSIYKNYTVKELKRKFPSFYTKLK